MNAIERDNTITAVGYESLVWVNDNQGRGYSCTLDAPRGNVHSFDELTEHERQSCMDVNLLVGTERW
jgi:hypothetical protein